MRNSNQVEGIRNQDEISLDTCVLILVSVIKIGGDSNQVEGVRNQDKTSLDT
jgi:hypothetical protein